MSLFPEILRHQQDHPFKSYILDRSQNVCYVIYMRTPTLLLLVLSSLATVSCSTSSYYPPSYPPERPVVLPYDGPSKVTYIDHGVVPSGAFSGSGYRRSYSSSSYGSGYSSRSGDSFESPFAWQFPDQYSSSSSCRSYTPVRTYQSYQPVSSFYYPSYPTNSSGSGSECRPIRLPRRCD